MKQPKIIVLIFFFLLVMGQLASGQSSIKASVDKNRVLLGETFQLSIELTIQNRSNELFKAPDTIPHFEFVDSPRFDTSSGDNDIRIKGIYQLTSFD